MKKFVCVSAIAIGLLMNLNLGSVFAKPMASYPTDPTANIAWSGGMSTVADIQVAFNNARAQENAQLGKNIPSMVLPSQATWNAMSDGDKAFWLSNRERIDRGVLAMHSTEANVTSVAQYYADYLLSHNVFSHDADGRTPGQRLYANATSNACHDGLWTENIAAFMTSGNSIPLPIERSVYAFMYVDSGSSWGHRHNILAYPYNDNSGPAGKEGFMGIGRAGGPYQGWNYGVVIVMDTFDPCAVWNYGSSDNYKVYLPLIVR